MRTNADLTLYNRYIDSTTRKEKFQRVCLIGVAWQNRKAANTLRMGSLEADAATVYIPFVLKANYLSPKAWQQLTDKTDKWTLQPGDVIIKGLVDDDISDAVTDPDTHVTTPAVTMTDLRAKYDDVLAITSIDTMDQGSMSMRHWQIGAK